jgi:hypothetical protein
MANDKFNHLTKFFTSPVTSLLVSLVGLDWGMANRLEGILVVFSSSLFLS